MPYISVLIVRPRVSHAEQSQVIHKVVMAQVARDFIARQPDHVRGAKADRIIASDAVLLAQAATPPF